MCFNDNPRLNGKSREIFMSFMLNTGLLCNKVIWWTPNQLKYQIYLTILYINVHSG